MTGDIIVEQLLLDDEFGYSIVAEPLSRNIDSILSDLQTARGAAFVTRLTKCQTPCEPVNALFPECATC